MPLGEMQVDSGDLEVAMAEQDLYRAQVRAGFEKVCGETMPQGVGMNAPVIEACALGGDLAGTPKNLGSDRVACRVPAIAGKQPLLRLAPESSPVDAKFLEQLQAKHDIAVPGTLAFPDMDNHAIAVDVPDLQMSCFCAARAGGIHGHQQDAMEGCIRGLNQSRDFFLTQNSWQVADLLRIRRLGDAPVTLQNVDVEEAQRRQAQDDGVRAELELGEQSRLILANVLWAELIGRAPKVLAEVRDTVQVRADGGGGEVAAMQLLKHELT